MQLFDPLRLPMREMQPRLSPALGIVILVLVLLTVVLTLAAGRRDRDRDASRPNLGTLSPRPST